MSKKRIHPRIDSPTARRSFQEQLLRWYDRNRRDLPWRADRDPYRVWLSEIMLQQTRVTAVLEHYRRFLRRFPTVQKLAGAREASVLAAWSGLGYYRRARMLHAAARTLVRRHAGRFPENAADLRRLPGIGRYTAPAIASIAFGQPVAVVDGNVERVLTRVTGESLAGEKLWQAAEQLLNRERPGDFNQAMMELGATICLPRQPRCLHCPVFGVCAARGHLQTKKKKTRQQRRQIWYALDHRNHATLLVRRPPHASLMPGMWELPEISGKNRKTQLSFSLRHSITMTDYLVRVVQGPAPGEVEGRWLPKSRIAHLPLTGLARKILRTANII